MKIIVSKSEREKIINLVSKDFILEYGGIYSPKRSLFCYPDIISAYSDSLKHGFSIERTHLFLPIEEIVFENMEMVLEIFSIELNQKLYAPFSADSGDKYKTYIKKV